jgi:hypothetical protein
MEFGIHIMRVQEQDSPRKRSWWLFPDNSTSVHDIFKSMMSRDKSIAYYRKARNIKATNIVAITYEGILNPAEAAMNITEVITRNRKKEEKKELIHE